MIPPQAAAKAGAGSRENDQADTCAEDVDRFRCLKGPLLSKTDFRINAYVSVRWSEKNEHVREHCHQNETKQKHNRTEQPLTP